MRIELVAVATGTFRSRLAMPPNHQRDASFLYRLRIADHALELKVVTLIGGNALVPKCLHNFDPLVRAASAISEILFQIQNLFFHPSDADPKRDSPLRILIEGGDLFGQDDRVSLRKDQHRGPEPNPLRRSRKQSHQDQRIWHIRIRGQRRPPRRLVRIPRIVSRMHHGMVDRPKRLKA